MMKRPDVGLSMQVQILTIFLEPINKPTFCLSWRDASLSLQRMQNSTSDLQYNDRFETNSGLTLEANHHFTLTLQPLSELIIHPYL